MVQASNSYYRPIPHAHTFFLFDETHPISH